MTPRKPLTLPPGEMLLLTIDRVVERECDDCDANGTPSTCPFTSYWHPEHSRGECGTGKRRVRVRGWCEVAIMPDASIKCVIRERDEQRISAIRLDVLLTDPDPSELCGRIIAAHIDGTLPDGVAHITEEVDADD